MATKNHAIAFKKDAFAWCHLSYFSFRLLRACPDGISPASSTAANRFCAVNFYIEVYT